MVRRSGGYIIRLDFPQSFPMAGTTMLEDKVWHRTWRLPLLALAAALPIPLCALAYCAYHWQAGTPRVSMAPITPISRGTVYTQEQRALEGAVGRYRVGMENRIRDRENLGFWAPLGLYGVSGTTGLRIAILPDGSIEQLSVAVSSGDPTMDEAACALVRRAAPFASFPKEMRGLPRQRFGRWLSLSHTNAPAQVPVVVSYTDVVREC
jgi:TonB family protein